MERFSFVQSFQPQLADLRRNIQEVLTYFGAQIQYWYDEYLAENITEQQYQEYRRQLLIDQNLNVEIHRNEIEAILATIRPVQAEIWRYPVLERYDDTLYHAYKNYEFGTSTDRSWWTWRFLYDRVEDEIYLLSMPYVFEWEQQNT